MQPQRTATHQHSFPGDAPQFVQFADLQNVFAGFNDTALAKRPHHPADVNRRQADGVSDVLLAHRELKTLIVHQPSLLEALHQLQNEQRDLFIGQMLAEVQAAARYVAPSIKEEGAAVMIERLILGRDV